MPDTREHKVNISWIVQFGKNWELEEGKKIRFCRSKK